MKKFTELSEALKSKRAVIAFGRFQPPHAGHSALLHHIHSFPGDKHVYVSGSHDSKENPFTAHERVKILHKMHPEYAKSIHAADENTHTIFKALAHAHANGYNHVTVVGGPDRKSEYEKILSTYNGKKDKKGNVPFHFKSWKVESEEKRVGAGGGGSGISGTKMRNAALSGDKATFRKGLHPNLTDEDMHHMMNTIRTRMGHKPMNEAADPLREEYISGNLFHVGDIVETKNGTETIANLGSNYVSTVDANGTLHRHWIHTITLSENKMDVNLNSRFYGHQVRFHGFRTSSFTKNIQEKFKPLFKQQLVEETHLQNLQLLMLLQSTDAMLKEWKTSPINYQKLRIEFDRSGKYLNTFSALAEHEEYRKEIEDALIVHELTEGAKIGSSDKMKAAKLIAQALDVPDLHKYTTPEDLVNAAAAHSRTKKFAVDGWKIVGKMMNTATKAGIAWNKDIFPKPTQKAIELQ